MVASRHSTTALSLSSLLPLLIVFAIKAAVIITITDVTTATPTEAFVIGRSVAGSSGSKKSIGIGKNSNNKLLLRNNCRANYHHGSRCCNSNPVVVTVLRAVASMEADEEAPAKEEEQDEERSLFFAMDEPSPPSSPSPLKATTTDKKKAIVIPRIDQWRLSPEDSTITGIVKHHPVLEDGEAITTAPLITNLSELNLIAGGLSKNASIVVKTASGIEYRLGTSANTASESSSSSSSSSPAAAPSGFKTEAVPSSPPTELIEKVRDKREGRGEYRQRSSEITPEEKTTTVAVTTATTATEAEDSTNKQQQQPPLPPEIPPPMALINQRLPTINEWYVDYSFDKARLIGIVNGLRVYTSSLALESIDLVEGTVITTATGADYLLGTNTRRGELPEEEEDGLSNDDGGTALGGAIGVVAVAAAALVGFTAGNDGIIDNPAALINDGSRENKQIIVLKRNNDDANMDRKTIGQATTSATSPTPASSHYAKRFAAMKERADEQKGKIEGETEIQKSSSVVTVPETTEKSKSNLEEQKSQVTKQSEGAAAEKTKLERKQRLEQQQLLLQQREQQRRMRTDAAQGKTVKNVVLSEIRKETAETTITMTGSDQSAIDYWKKVLPLTFAGGIVVAAGGLLTQERSREDSQDEEKISGSLAETKVVQADVDSDSMAEVEERRGLLGLETDEETAGRTATKVETNNEGPYCSEKAGGDEGQLTTREFDKPERRPSVLKRTGSKVTGIATAGVKGAIRIVVWPFIVVRRRLRKRKKDEAPPLPDVDESTVT